jgi:protoporphyrinogen oxidase
MWRSHGGWERLRMSQRIVVIGAGPAGLAAAHELARHGHQSLVIDKNDRVGGLARTIWRDGYGFDLGPHRFFTKNHEVLELWQEYLGDDLLDVDRLTRIYYRGRFFAYPLKPLDALAKLGPATTAKAVASYARERLRRHPDEPKSFEDWIVSQFGRVLFDVFFKSYTEKVWGIPCDQIGKEWAGQRIRGLNLAQAVRHAFGRGRSQQVRSLVERYQYPRLGAGQLYDAMAARLESGGSEVRTGVEVVRIETDGDRITRVHCDDGSAVDVAHVFASAPITGVATALEPAAPGEVLDAAESLYYRSHITVNLVVEQEAPFPDNWIYIQSPELRMARVANYASFSKDLIGRPGTCGLSVEYFCFETDDLWAMSERELLDLAAREMDRSGLLDASTIADGFVVKEKESYPTYYLGHRAHFDVLFVYLSRFRNLSLIGRAGMYRYNNQDHASLTGLYAARNHLGLSDVDLFAINPEDEYIEEVRTGYGVERR